MTTAQGQVITPRSLERDVGPALFYTPLGADKVSADCTRQMKCKVESTY